jgi:hypothetical protein
MKPTYFGRLNEINPTPFLNGKTNIRKKDSHIGKQGGRIRAFLMTDHNEELFQHLQTLQKPIPVDLFHCSDYDDEILTYIIHIHLQQKKYIPLNVGEIWTQTEYRRQVEPYCREYQMELSKRCFEEDVRIIIAWFFDLNIGIQTRIIQYNEMLKMKTLNSISISFDYFNERKMSLKNIKTRRKRKQISESNESKSNDELKNNELKNEKPADNEEPKNKEMKIMNQENNYQLIETNCEIIQNAIQEIETNYHEEMMKDNDDALLIDIDIDVEMFNECVEQLQLLKQYKEGTDQAQKEVKKDQYQEDVDFCLDLHNENDLDDVEFYLQYKHLF